MKKYCRYCVYCVSGDCYYCTEHKKELRRINTVTKCKDFVFSELGDVDSGKQYRPRQEKKNRNIKQLSLFSRE